MKAVPQVQVPGFAVTTVPALTVPAIVGVAELSAAAATFAVVSVVWVFRILPPIVDVTLTEIFLPKSPPTSV
ncbi:hypothetical protein [Arthrobacter sp. LAR12-1-1.1]|uniref:hypothetical protein n=1 Tax=Arthrobacter sp. LAR12-1-1.1 TaxID=3135215 RepID=UPI0034378632